MRITGTPPVDRQVLKSCLKPTGLFDGTGGEPDSTGFAAQGLTAWGPFAPRTRNHGHPYLQPGLACCVRGMAGLHPLGGGLVALRHPIRKPIRELSLQQPSSTKPTGKIIPPGCDEVVYVYKYMFLFCFPPETNQAECRLCAYVSGPDLWKRGTVLSPNINYIHKGNPRSLITYK